MNFSGFPRHARFYLRALAAFEGFGFEFFIWLQNEFGSFIVSPLVAWFDNRFSVSFNFVVLCGSLFILCACFIFPEVWFWHFTCLWYFIIWYYVFWWEFLNYRFIYSLVKLGPPWLLVTSSLYFFSLLELYFPISSFWEFSSLVYLVRHAGTEIKWSKTIVMRI